MAKKWTNSAPSRLVRAYEEGHIRNGRAILESLLSDERMLPTWKQLSKKGATTDDDWMQIWRFIAYAKKKSNAIRDAKATFKRKRPSDERDEYKALAQKFLALAKKIENKPLDVLAFELLSEDTLAALQVPNLHERVVLDRNYLAHKLLNPWPSASELLYGLERYALRLANEVVNNPRPDARDRGDIEARTFVWYLGQDFRSHFGSPMLGSLANIAEVTFMRPVDKHYSRSFIQGALRGV